MTLNLYTIVKNDIRDIKKWSRVKAESVKINLNVLTDALSFMHKTLYLVLKFFLVLLVQLSCFHEHLVLRRGKS